MTLNYEAVFYGVGQVKKDSPSGFAVFHYDNSPSPLSLAGGGNNSIFGPGGVVPGALDIFGDVSNILNPDVGTSPLGVLGTVIKGANLVRNVKGITKESLRAEGYKILDNTLRDIARGSLNGLGVNLNLNKGSNYATSGQFLGTPVAVVTAAALGQEFGPGGTTTQSTSANGKTPTSANSADASDAAKAKLEQTQDAIDNSSPSEAGDDSSPSGNTPSAGTYFSPVEPITDTAEYRDDFIDELSAPEDVDLALNELNSSWASDNEFVAGQSPNPDEISTRLNDAASFEEYTAIKNDADTALESARSAQALVDAKYQAEFQRLSSLKQQLASRTSGSGAVSGAGDAGSSVPSIESSSTPVDDFDF